MSAEDIQNRILTLHQRQLASLVDDISRIEATSYVGVGVEKIYLHEGADVTRAVSQLASSALVVLKYMPRNITPPLVLRYSATDVPIIQLSLSSNSLPDTKLNDLGQNTIRPNLAVVQVPFPTAASRVSSWRIWINGPYSRADSRRRMSAKLSSART